MMLVRIYISIRICLSPDFSFRCMYRIQNHNEGLLCTNNCVLCTHIYIQICVKSDIPSMYLDICMWTPNGAHDCISNHVTYNSVQND